MRSSAQAWGRTDSVVRFLSYIPRVAGLVLLATFALAGGSSHADAPTQIVVRLVAVAVIGALLVVGDYRSLARVRVPTLLVGGAVVLAVLHLVPLPFALWSSLPGRAFVVTADMLAGANRPWRPLSLDPDKTFNALVSLLPVMAALLVAATMRERDLRRASWAIVAVAILSAVIALLQLGGVGGDRLHYYDLASIGEATGLFPNRNHNAALLVCGMVLIAHLPSEPRFALLKLSGIAFLAVSVMLIQSRSGMLIAVVALALCYRALRRLIREAQRSGGGPQQPRPRWQAYGIVVAAVVLVGLGVLAAAQSGSFARFLTASDSDTRFSILGPVTDLAWHYFPAGSGLGTFDPVFRIAEPLSALSPEYFNHAHNDLIETVITAGLPGLVLIAVFAVWLAASVRRAWRADNELWAAVLVVLVLLGQSLVDYPLRTPLLGGLFVLALVWMCRLPTVLYPDGRDD